MSLVSRAFKIVGWDEPPPLPSTDDAAVVPLPLTFRSRVRRRSAVGRWGDGVVQGAVVGFLAVAAGTSALLLHAFNAVVGEVIALTVLGWCSVAFVVLVHRAGEKEKLLAYREGGHALRLQLRYVRAERELYRRSLDISARLRDQVAEYETAQFGLIQLADALHDVLATWHDDLAIVLVKRVPDRHLILYLAVGPGNRWQHLRPGKSCPVRGRTFDETLEALAPFTRSFALGISEIDLWVGVLSRDQFTSDDERVLANTSQCLENVARELGVALAQGRRLKTAACS